MEPELASAQEESVLDRRPQLVYLPTMSPEGVMAVACVLVAPGKSNEMTPPFPKVRVLLDKFVI